VIIAVDIGTTNVKAVAFSPEGRVLASAFRENETLRPEAGHYEQDPEALLQNVVEALRDLTTGAPGPESWQALSFSCALHSLILLDSDKRLLSRAWLWSDLRASDTARNLRQDRAGEELYRRTGVPLHPMAPLIKIRWLREHDPALFARTRWFVGIKEYILYRLTGELNTDISSASATGLMDLESMKWETGALAAAGITAGQLPPLVSPYYLIRLQAAPEAAPFLLPGLGIVVGASDGPLANLGAGALDEGSAALTIGTSGALRVGTSRPLLDARTRTFCYRLDEKMMVAGGGTNNGANALEWLGALLGYGDDMESLTAQAGSSAPGADGLVFLPYLYGERAPVWNPEARGAFIGLDAAHGQSALVRAVMEGIVYNLKWIGEALELHAPIRRIFATGGFSANEFWIQMIADIFEREIVISTPEADASATGAFLMAQRALGLPEIPAALPAAQPDRTFHPQPQHQAAYRLAYQTFKSLYEKIYQKGHDH
jgi:gluconokinase